MRFRFRELDQLENFFFSVKPENKLQEINTSLEEFRGKLFSGNLPYIEKVLAFSLHNLSYQDTLGAIYFWLRDINKKINLTKGYIRPEDLDEITSATLLAVISSRSRFSIKLGKATSWLLKILQNNARNQIRQQYYSQTSEVSENRFPDWAQTNREKTLSSREEVGYGVLVTLVNYLGKALRKLRVQTVWTKLPQNKQEAILELIYQDLFVPELQRENIRETSIDVTKSLPGREILRRVISSLALRTHDDRFLAINLDILLERIREEFRKSRGKNRRKK